MRLSADEIRLIVVVILALTVGAAVKYYRDRNPESPISAPARPESVSFERAGY